MASLLSKLLGPRNEVTFPFPGKRGKPVEEGGMDASVTLWELGGDEIADAAQDAIDWLARKYKMERDQVRGLIEPVYIDHETKVQQLFRAMRNPQDTKQPYALAAVEVRALPPADIQFLHERFVDLQVANSEYLSLKLEELQRMVLEDLGKAPTPENFWQRCDSVSARALGMALEQRCSELTRRVADLESLLATSMLSSPSSPSSQ